MKYLLDTDICIYWLKGKSTVRTKIEQVDWSDIAICVITATELYFGAYFDLLIASVAIAKNLILVTNNTRHYQRITGLNLENWNSE
ncbi:MAG: hypothetical protein QNJ72_12650 [Pleurocapsa sp. MO_226.B13]|nr:hypothetical protein [Pleurocapsa sp. MO_226.B13]